MSDLVIEGEGDLKDATQAENPFVLAEMISGGAWDMVRDNALNKLPHGVDGDCEEVAVESIK